MNGRQLRNALRGAHLVAAVVAAFVLYAEPLFSAATARAALAFVLVPLLGLSGIAMWQQVKIRNFFQRSAKARAGRAPAAERVAPRA